MALYSDHLDDVIYKSKFKVDIADAFISPSGEIIMADSFCHCNLAYNIIRDATENHYKKLDRMTKEINRMTSYLKDNKNDSMQYQLNSMIQQLSDMKHYGSCQDMFNAIHINKGYDEAEFIVAYLGYIGIEGHYLLYNRKMINGIQLATLGLNYYYENGGKIIDNE